MEHKKKDIEKNFLEEKKPGSFEYQMKHVDVFSLNDDLFHNERQN